MTSPESIPSEARCVARRRSSALRDPSLAAFAQSWNNTNPSRTFPDPISEGASDEEGEGVEEEDAGRCGSWSNLEDAERSGEEDEATKSGRVTAPAPRRRRHLAPGVFLAATSSSSRRKIRETADDAAAGGDGGGAVVSNDGRVRRTPRGVRGGHLPNGRPKDLFRMSNLTADMRAAVLDERPPVGLNGAEFWQKPEPPGLTLARFPMHASWPRRRRLLGDVTAEQAATSPSPRTVLQLAAELEADAARDPHRLTHPVAATGTKEEHVGEASNGGGEETATAGDVPPRRIPANVREWLVEEDMRAAGIHPGTLDRVCRLVEVYCGGFHNLTDELLHSCRIDACADARCTSEGAAALMQKVWTVFVEQCEDRFRTAHGNHLAKYLRDAEEVRLNLSEAAVRAGAEVAHLDAVNRLAHVNLRRARAAMSVETKCAARAEMKASEAERKRTAAASAAEEERRLRERAESEVRELTLIPVKMSEQARRLHDLGEKAESLSSRLEAANQINNQGKKVIASANARTADAMHRLGLERARRENLREELRLLGEARDALRATNAKLRDENAWLKQSVAVAEEETAGRALHESYSSDPTLAFLDESDASIPVIEPFTSDCRRTYTREPTHRRFHSRPSHSAAARARTVEVSEHVTAMRRTVLDAEARARELARELRSAEYRERVLKDHAAGETARQAAKASLAAKSEATAKAAAAAAAAPVGLATAAALEHEARALRGELATVRGDLTLAREDAARASRTLEEYRVRAEEARERMAAELDRYVAAEAKAASEAKAEREAREGAEAASAAECERLAGELAALKEAMASAAHARAASEARVEASSEELRREAANCQHQRELAKAAGDAAAALENALGENLPRERRDVCFPIDNGLIAPTDNRRVTFAFDPTDATCV